MTKKILLVLALISNYWIGMENFPLKNSLKIEQEDLYDQLEDFEDPSVICSPMAKNIDPITEKTEVKNYRLQSVEMILIEILNIEELNHLIPEYNQWISIKKRDKKYHSKLMEKNEELIMTQVDKKQYDTDYARLNRYKQSSMDISKHLYTLFEICKNKSIENFLKEFSDDLKENESFVNHLNNLHDQINEINNPLWEIFQLGPEL